ncbi:hypothetical protein [Herbiconiux flava]|uniref:Uncharacterized protein n=1 Tax=Herbiconiux flava TaxID=881268 RepID=A0A852SLU8_9MICO|nr:hypothetical protein [Herbiconiux flava]NYD69459.1 hypothetical protein [Herbiconiux flava]GLK16204.1 hypothetical protein GCM10017602_06860 [Herbiconiux flava]
MSDRVAAEVYDVVMVDRRGGPLRRAVRWGGTVAAGLLDGSGVAPAVSGNAPAVLELSICSDGVELRRVAASDVTGLADLHDRMLLQLETTTPEQFAESWELPAR